MEKITLNKLASLLRFKRSQNLYHLEKVGKFNPDKTMTGKVILTPEFAFLLKEGYQPLCWEAYLEAKRKGAEALKIIDFYDIPVVFLKK